LDFNFRDRTLRARFNVKAWIKYEITLEGVKKLDGTDSFQEMHVFGQEGEAIQLIFEKNNVQA